MADASRKVEIASSRMFGLVEKAVVVGDLVAGECWLVTACEAWRHPLKPFVLE